ADLRRRRNLSVERVAETLTMYLWNKPSPSLLGAYRPNQAMQRVYGGYAALQGLGAPPVFSIPQLKEVRPLGHWKNVAQAHTGPGMSGLGQDSTTTSLLLGGAAVIGLGWLLLRGRRGGSDKKRIARLAAQRALASRSLKEAGA